MAKVDASTAVELELDNFSLEPVKAPKVVTPEQVEKYSGSAVTNEKGEVVKDEKGEEKVKTITKLEQQVIENLNGQVDNILNTLVKTSHNSPEMKNITANLSRMGDAEILKTSTMSNRMLNRPLRGLRENGEGGADIASSMKKLRGKMKDLDPSKRDALFSKNRVFGIKLPFNIGGKVDDYFQEYRSSQDQLNDILQSLSNGKDALIEDNCTIDEEREQMSELMIKLEQYAYVMKRLDKKISDKLEDIQADDQLKARDIKSEILFPIRQKRMDLLQHLAVCMQGYQALEVIKQNNTELIRGVDRAKTTTMAALRTAVMVSQALGTQKLVLEQVNSVNEMTNNLIKASAEQLEETGVEIHKQAAQSAINAETLEQAFVKIFKAMDAMDSYRENALPEMEKTIGSLEKSIENAKDYLSSRRQNRLEGFAEELTTTSDNDKDGAVTIMKTKAKV
jgi:uncharacterized protein YaaN involved in tellurite resistance